MRYADAHTQPQLELLQRKGGRPPNSSGWGMLVACKTGEFVSERNPADHVDITAGKTHVCRDYWLARERPELFKPADSRDAPPSASTAPTSNGHAKSSSRAGRAADRHDARGVLAPKGVLPPKPAFRLPRRAPPTRALPKR